MVSCLPRLKKLTPSSCIFALGSRLNHQLIRVRRPHCHPKPSQARGYFQPPPQLDAETLCLALQAIPRRKAVPTGHPRREQPGAYAQIWFQHGSVKSCYGAGQLCPLQFLEAGLTWTLPWS